MSLLQYQHFYLIGIKGVAMTSMTQLLIDAGKNVSGSDVAAKFVTQEILDKLKIKIETDFAHKLPVQTECVIYTAAHQAKNNPQVKEALARQLPTFSQAAAIAQLFNQQQGVAVCGVGGKSTVSAMIVWILEKLNTRPSFSVGVGNIPGLNKTGQWNKTAKNFIIEADEYVIDPEKGTKATPRFSFLKPFLTVCTNLKFDHPDVYQDFKQTQQVFNQFFSQTQKLIANFQDSKLIKLPHLTFGENPQADMFLSSYQSQAGQTFSQFQYQDQIYNLTLQIPGKFNVINALSAILALAQLGYQPQQAAAALADFSSTKRRFEFIGQKNGVKYYDDYAHHPHEVKAAIQALHEWYPAQKKVIAFQSHTYSRTKTLFDEFIDAFQTADQVLMIDIFSSAREKSDSTITSTKLCQGIQDKYQIPAENLKSLQNLANYCKKNLKPGDVLLTLGAGDIYQVHELI